MYTKDKRLAHLNTESGNLNVRFVPHNNYWTLELRADSESRYTAFKQYRKKTGAWYVARVIARRFGFDSAVLRSAM